MVYVPVVHFRIPGTTLLSHSVCLYVEYFEECRVLSAHTEFKNSKPVTK
jgi:hypothetical protein